MKPKDPSYRETQKIWYAKLKKGGFKDIEDQNGFLKEWDFNFFRNQFNSVEYEATLGYFAQAREILISYSFKNETHRKIWELHCEGLSERSIAFRIRKYKKSMIHYIIDHIAQQIKG